MALVYQGHLSPWDGKGQQGATSPAPLTSHDQPVEGTPQRAVPHERGAVDAVFAHADVGKGQGEEVAPHLAPVRGLVVGTCEGTEGDPGTPHPGVGE